MSNFLHAIDQIIVVLNTGYFLHNSVYATFEHLQVQPIFPKLVFFSCYLSLTNYTSKLMYIERSLSATDFLF